MLNDIVNGTKELKEYLVHTFDGVPEIDNGGWAVITPFGRFHIRISIYSNRIDIYFGGLHFSEFHISTKYIDFPELGKTEFDTFFRKTLTEYFQLPE